MKRTVKVSQIEVQIASKLETCAGSKRPSMNKFTCRQVCSKFTTEYRLNMSLVIDLIVSEVPREICMSYSAFLYSGLHFQQLSIRPLIGWADPIFLVCSLGLTILLEFLSEAFNIISGSSYAKLQVISPLLRIYRVQIGFFSAPLYSCSDRLVYY